MKFVNPQNDIAFRKIFGDVHRKDVLISFLNAVLGLEGTQAIADIELLSPFETPKVDLLKQTILDVKACDVTGKQFIVEMQVSGYPALRKRFQYYAAKTYANQIEVGEDYPKLNQVIFIGILNFTEFEGEAWLTRHLLLNTETGQQDLKDIEFNFIELPKFTKTEAQLDSLLDKWLWFLKHARDLDIIPPHAQPVPALTHAYETADRHGWSKDDFEIYESIAMRRRGEQDQLASVLEQGRAEGQAKGEAKGRRDAEFDALYRLLKKRFGVIPSDVVTMIERADAGQIENWFDAAITAERLDTVFDSVC